MHRCAQKKSVQSVFICVPLFFQIFRDATVGKVHPFTFTNNLTPVRNSIYLNHLEGVRRKRNGKPAGRTFGVASSDACSPQGAAQ